MGAVRWKRLGPAGSADAPFSVGQCRWPIKPTGGEAMQVSGTAAIDAKAGGDFAPGQTSVEL